MDKVAWREWYDETYLHTEHWHGVQKVVYGRNGGRCERCDTNDMEHIHHVHYCSLWHELEDPTSVMGVCAECHGFLHGHSTYDPAAEVPDEEPTHEQPTCADCGWVAEAMTDDEEPICKDCWRQRYESD
jgi:hypothetical protein